MLNLTVNLLVLCEIRCYIFFTLLGMCTNLYKKIEQRWQTKGDLFVVIIYLISILIPFINFLTLKEFIVYIPLSFFITSILPIMYLKSRGSKLNDILAFDTSISLMYGSFILINTIPVLDCINYEMKGIYSTLIYIAISCILARIFSLNTLVSKKFSVFIGPIIFLELCLFFNNASTFQKIEQSLMYLRIPYSAEYWDSNICILYLILAVSGLMGSILSYYYLSINKIKFLVIRVTILLLLLLLEIYILTYLGFNCKSKFVDFRPDIWVTILYINSNMVYLILCYFIDEKKIFINYLELNNLKSQLESLNTKPGTNIIFLGLMCYILLFANYFAILGLLVLVLNKGLEIIIENIIILIDSNLVMKNGLVFMNIGGPGDSGNNGSNMPGDNNGGGPSNDNLVTIDPDLEKRRKAFNHKWERLGRRLFADLSRTERRVEARNRALARRAANPGPFKLSPLTSVTGTVLPIAASSHPFNFSPLISPATLHNVGYPGPSGLSTLTTLTPAALDSAAGSDWQSLDASVQKEQSHLRIRPNDCFDNLEYTRGNSLEKGIAIDHIINLILKHKEVGGRRVKSSLFSTCPHIGKFICKHLLDTQPEYARIHLMDKALDGEIRPVLGRLETPHDKFLVYFKK